MTVIRRKEDKGVHSMNIQKIFARTLGALMIAGLTGCATIESFLEVAAPIAEGISQGMAGSTAATYQAAARSNTCGGYPLQTIGTAPAGYVCRCSYASGSSSPGWWAVRPGNPSGGVMACSPPSGSASTNVNRYSNPPAASASTRYGSLPNSGGAITGGSNSRMQPKATLVPNVNNCIKTESTTSIISRGALPRSKLTAKATNTCSEPVTVSLCLYARSANNNRRCPSNLRIRGFTGTGFGGRLESGRTLVEEWFYNPHESDEILGINKFACPLRSQGNGVVMLGSIDGTKRCEIPATSLGTR